MVHACPPPTLSSVRKSQSLIERALSAGRLGALFGSRVVEIGERRVRLELADGSAREVDNDYVFVFAGGVPPLDLLRRAGVRFGGEPGGSH